jgi:hypothetical protein
VWVAPLRRGQGFEEGLRCRTGAPPVVEEPALLDLRAD